MSVDTSTPTGSVAVSRGETLLGEVLINTAATHTDRLLPSIRQLLQDVGVGLADLDGFGVTLGPGSFTGLRVGIATVKGLAMATGKPVAGVSSLQALAAQMPCSRYPLCALLDARKKEVYAGLYHWQGGMPALVGKERVLPPETLLEEFAEDVLFVGNGAVVYRTVIVRRLGERAHFAPWPLNTPRASAVSALALADFRNGQTLSPVQLAPSYIRPSEAELMLARR